MVKVEVSKVEEQLNHRFLFNVCVNAVQGRMDFPIGSRSWAPHRSMKPPWLRWTLHFAEDLAAPVRLQLTAAACNP